jgi:hypothetical protein
MFVHKFSGTDVKCDWSFEKDGLIELHEKDIVVANHKELVEISKKG